MMLSDESMQGLKDLARESMYFYHVDIRDNEQALVFLNQILDDLNAMGRINAHPRDVPPEWKPISEAPRDTTSFICREKRKPHVQFEAAIFEDQESWEMPSTCYCLQNMTTDEPLTGAWEDYEWKPIPEGDQ